jgi:hypothetical protein
MSNKLHYYFPHGVKVREKYVDWDSWNICPFIYKQLEKLDSDASYELQPYLYPLSCLTETIVHNGKEDIPLVELAKIEGTYTGEEYEIYDDRIEWKTNKGSRFSFWYSQVNQSFLTKTNSVGDHCFNQLLLFDYLYIIFLRIILVFNQTSSI